MNNTKICTKCGRACAMWFTEKCRFWNTEPFRCLNCHQNELEEKIEELRVYEIEIMILKRDLEFIKEYILKVRDLKRSRLVYGKTEGEN